KASDGRPFTTLAYTNGPGYRAEHPRPDLCEVDTSDPAFIQEATIPLSRETHGGEDVALYADGPRAHLFRGVMEQHVIFHVMMDALGLGNP
ncbi:MAG: alkaline phosphatase, partial [Planctomycetota bacterium]